MTAVAAYGTRTLPELLAAIDVQLADCKTLLRMPASARPITLREAQRLLFNLKDERDDRFPDWYATAVALGYEK